jgi:hypothetical protein
MYMCIELRQGLEILKATEVRVRWLFNVEPLPWFFLSE